MVSFFISIVPILHVNNVTFELDLSGKMIHFHQFIIFYVYNWMRVRLASFTLENEHRIGGKLKGSLHQFDCDIISALKTNLK